MSNKFEHKQFAHCESGVVSTLLSFYGLKISEPMAFGITSSLSFVYLPIIKLNGLPLIAYRELPKNIINKISKVLGIKIKTEKFKDPIQANNRLTQLVNNENKLVGLQTSVYYLPYMPEDMRFHFNAHNLLVYGKEGSKYKISDPVFEEVVECEESKLMRARFAKGAFAPKGFLYYPEDTRQNIDFSKAIKKAIRKNAKSMLTPFPFAGIKGMKRLARKIENLYKEDTKYIQLFLTHIVRMQEEIGTGGGGFRFLYAAFLKEAMQYDIDNEILEKTSTLFVKSGDTLREFALLCVNGSRNLEKLNLEKISNKLQDALSYEEEAYRILKKI
ncbi:BtrH N-terminal domain-containing protein [Arcobacteraceae bacterium]|nr:BtrH N-terminal domain-containing protein [Arcobacteraceae bacterium]